MNKFRLTFDRSAAQRGEKSVWRLQLDDGRVLRAESVFIKAPSIAVYDSAFNPPGAITGEGIIRTDIYVPNGKYIVIFPRESVDWPTSCERIDELAIN
jgi:hypothetical protein